MFQEGHSALLKTLFLRIYRGENSTPCSGGGSSPLWAMGVGQGNEYPQGCTTLSKLVWLLKGEKSRICPTEAGHCEEE